MENKEERIKKAISYLTQHNVEFDANTTMTVLEKQVEHHKIALRKQNRANNKETKVKASLVAYDILNEENLKESLYNLKGTPENPYKVSAKFGKTYNEFKKDLKSKELSHIFEVHQENWLGTKLNQPTMSVNNLTFYKEEFSINLEIEQIKEIAKDDEWEDEEID